MHNKNKKIPASSFKFSDLLTADYLIITAILVVLPLLVYGQVYNFEFVWDDYNPYEIRHLNNAFVRSPSWENFWTLFSQPYFGMYIPVSYFTWGVLKFFAEWLPLPLSSVLHLTNVVLHIINGLLVFTILKKFVISKWAVLIGSLFFLLHPLQVEVVAWVSEFRTLLAFFFSLLALNFYLKNQTKPNFLSLFLFILALLSKPSAVVLPLIMVAINHFYYQFSLIENLKKTLPFALIALVAAVIIINLQSFGMPDGQIASYAQRPIIWLNNIALYLKYLIYPVNLSAVYGLPVPYMVHQWWFYFLPLIPLGLAIGLWFVRKKQPLLIWASILFLIGFLPTAGFVSFSFQIAAVIADRYLYFSFIGVALAIASLSHQQYWRAFFISIFLIFTALSAFRQIPVWHNEIKLWNHAVNNSEYDSYYAKRALGSALHNQGWDLAKRGKNQQALVIFDNIIADKFNHKLYFIDNTFYLRGVIMMQQKHYQKALADFNQSIKINDKNSGAHEGKIAVFIALKQCKKAWQQAGSMQKIPLKIHPTVSSQLKRECL